MHFVQHSHLELPVCLHQVAVQVSCHQWHAHACQRFRGARAYQLEGAADGRPGALGGTQQQQQQQDEQQQQQDEQRQARVMPIGRSEWPVQTSIMMMVLPAKPLINGQW
jgi:hypothetical protein